MTRAAVLVFAALCGSAAAATADDYLVTNLPGGAHIGSRFH